MKRGRKFLRPLHSGVFAVLTTLAPAWLAPAAAQAPAGEPILIGVSTAESPPGAVVQGVQIKDGIAIMVDKINSEGGVLGRPLKILYEDNQGIPEKGRAAVEKLITRGQVVALTGGHQSSVCLAEAEVAHRYKLPYVNTNCWTDDLRAKGYAEVFNLANYNSRVSAAIAQTVAELNVKTVVAFAENTDYGVGQARLIAEMLKAAAPQVDYRYLTLDRAGKDFTPAVLAQRAAPPEMVINIMLPPAAYILASQLYEQGVAPSAKTWFYDTGLADYPDFWQNVGEAGQYMMVFGLYHPKMSFPPLGDEIVRIYETKHKNQANRLLLQAADSILLIARAIEHAQSTDGAALVQAMKEMEFDGVRGRFRFSQEPGYRFQQWVEMPYVTYQITQTRQPLAETTLIQDTGQPLHADLLQRPSR